MAAADAAWPAPASTPQTTVQFLPRFAYRDAVADCTKCALSDGRTQVVFGAGSPNAELMFVGEAPGFHEDKQGVPFVGAAGQLLTKLLPRSGSRARTSTSTTSLKCRPPGNRDPQPDEIQSCEPQLWRKSSSSGQS